MRSIVLKNDPSIQVALRRLARMQQVKRLNLDFIERELFDDNFKMSVKIKLNDLSITFASKLGLTQAEATSFARFLVEETDDSQGKEQILFNPKLKINHSMVVARLMTYSLYPVIYRDNHEREAKLKFRAAFANLAKQSELVDLFEHEDHLYEISDFILAID